MPSLRQSYPISIFVLQLVWTMKTSQALNLLNGLSARQFLRDYWQKKPLLVRAAIRDFAEPLSIAEIFELAGREEAESRLISRRGRDWALQNGPLPPKAFRAAAGARWTVLVQDTQHHSHEAHRLLQEFSFIPNARVDDLMVSYAVKGGGVGPHFDSYDVFLLQGQGKRRWQVSAQTDLRLKPGMPLKILSHFKAESEWVLEAGDMLYLPPGYAHNGIAETDCTTWSVGFRAPSRQELTVAFLDYLRDQLCLDGLYTDQDLSATRHPGQVDRRMEARVSSMLGELRQAVKDPERLRRFIGCHFTEPKAQVVFEAPDSPFGLRSFRNRAQKAGLELDLRSRMLYDASGTQVYVNGEAIDTTGFSRADLATCHSLADMRALTPAMVAAAGSRVMSELHAAYCDGYLHIGNGQR
jgi:50S ribosomal protein L16 3-hydroxylase